MAFKWSLFEQCFRRSSTGFQLHVTVCTFVSQLFHNNFCFTMLLCLLCGFFYVCHFLCMYFLSMPPMRCCEGCPGQSQGVARVVWRLFVQLMHMTCCRILTCITIRAPRGCSVQSTGAPRSVAFKVCSTMDGSFALLCFPCTSSSDCHHANIHASYRGAFAFPGIGQ